MSTEKVERFLSDYHARKHGINVLVQERDRVKDVIRTMEMIQGDSLSEALLSGVIQVGVAYDFQNDVAVVITTENGQKKLVFFPKDSS